MKILSACRKDRHIVGARPNFMKAAPIMREMAKYPQEFEQLLATPASTTATRRCYNNMSKGFFEGLEKNRDWARNVQTG